MLARIAALAIAGLALTGVGQAGAKGPVDPVLDMAAGFGSTWAVSGFDLVQVAGRSGELVGRTRLGPAYPLAVATGGGAVWVVGSYLGVRRRFAALWQVHPASGRRVGRAIGMDAEPVGVAVGGGAVWVLDRAHGRLLGFSASTRRLVHQIRIGRAPMALAAGAGAIWVTRAGLRRRPVRHGSVACTLVRVDPRRGSVRELRVPRGCLREGLAVSRSAVWVAGRWGRLTRVGPAGRQRRTWRVGGAIVGRSRPRRAPLAGARRRPPGPGRRRAPARPATSRAAGRAAAGLALWLAGLTGRRRRLAVVGHAPGRRGGSP